MRSVIVGLAILSVVGAWWWCFAVTQPAWLVSEQNIQDYGTFGDSFGTVNALFSGLGFIGVAIALSFQARDAKRQREEFSIQARIAACAAIIEAEKTLSDYYEQAASRGAPAPIPAEPNITWADMLENSRKRILDMSAELEKSRKELLEE